MLNGLPTYQLIGNKAMKTHKQTHLAGYVAAIILLATAATLIFAWFTLRSQATHASYGPKEIEAAENDGFPVIDWDYWRDINQDVIGWITIPGTNIDFPIVEAHRDDPDFYLSHDVYRQWNPYGAVFLDASCTEGLDSVNAVVLGHHMDDNTMFSAVASYADRTFAQDHRTVLVQTPNWRRAFDVYAAEIIAGWEPVKQTRFATTSQFEAYVARRMAACCMRFDELMSQSRPSSMMSLVTCSYTLFPDNERTVAYAW